jgi:DNA-binding CsgD family transcriptional regulator/tetratricopeptide (TPR) repeat protein
MHAALAEVSDPDADPDRRAWHLALAAPGPDDGIAAELERSAGRAQTRGGLAAAAAFLDRATSMTVDPAGRARRALAAAQAGYQAGDPDAAVALLATARTGPLSDLQHAQADLLDAQIAFTTSRDRGAPGLLLEAARRLEPLDVAAARETYLEALMAAQFAGHLAPGAAVEIARAARSAPAPPSPRAADALLDGFAVMLTDGHAAAGPLLRAAIDAFADGDLANGGPRWLWLAQDAAQEVWDHDSWYALAMLQLRLVRETGALTVLPLAFTAVVCARIYAGELATAAPLVDDQRNALEATGTRMAPYAELILTAWRGREAELTALVDATLEEVVPRGEGIGVTTCRWVTAVLQLGLGRFADALASAEQALDGTKPLDWPAKATLPELVEAAARSGRLDRAREALERFSAVAGPSGTDWALGLEARCRALVSEPASAEPLYREAIERLGRTCLRAEQARSHLLYGEWLHAAGRAADAREQLLTAHGMFTEMGMAAFADRARRELPATAPGGERRTGARDGLTAQERQIARLAREGLSNPEIGSRLFLSPRTVEWHLGKVFAKLGVRSRHELGDALPAAGPEPAGPSGEGAG